MTNSVEKFDPSTLMNGIRDRVKATFVSLIPDDQWEAMIKRECDAFFEVKRQNGDYKYFSDFQKICNDVITEIARQKVMNYMAQYDSQIWDSTTQGYKANDLLKKLIAENASEIFAGAFGNMMQQVVNNMKSRY